MQARYGILSRQASRVYYAHVRSATVEQALWERLMGVGTVRVGTGATGEHEVSLDHVADPQLLEKELQRRYQPFLSSRARRAAPT